MKLEYADSKISSKVALYAVCKMLIGLGILTLPSAVVGGTHSSDGWMSIVLGGFVAMAFAYFVTRLLSRFPGTGYRDIAAALTNKPVGNALTLLFAVSMFMFASHELRGVSTVSKHYLFDTTPLEAICLTFLLVLVYGVAGPSVSLLRLNLLFLPIILVIVALVIIMSAPHFDYHLLKPTFITPLPDVLKATKETAFSFLGFEILLVYNVYIHQPSRTGKAAIIGVIVPMILYLLVFLFVVGVFGTAIVNNTLYPLAELAKQVEVPGGFFERFESVFFVIWVMALFCTAAMAFDVAILAMMSVFGRVRRMTVIYWMAPCLLLAAMQPQDVREIRIFAQWVSYSVVATGWIIPTLLLAMAKIRGVKGNA